jgi:hypothetical protein
MAGLALTQGKALVIGLNKADAVPGSITNSVAIRPCCFHHSLLL